MHTLLIAVYVIGFFATPYIMGRIFDEDCDFLIIIPMLFWPVFAIFAIPGLLGSFLLDLGNSHRKGR